MAISVISRAANALILGLARDRRPLASRRVLSMVAPSHATSWKTTHRCRMPQAGSTDGRRKPSLGRSADSRRVTQAGNRGLGTDGLRVLAGVAKEIVTDLAHI